LYAGRRLGKITLRPSLKMSDAIGRIQLLDEKWDGEWHITVEVFRDLGLAGSWPGLGHFADGGRSRLYGPFSHDRPDSLLLEPTR
jgi:hypothetical protein